MKINKIKLYNFGSYEGEMVFDTSTDSEQNIIVFGGKNGAGKTTLFKSITLCLYGCLSLGYKYNNSFYTKKIIKLINNNAKKNKPTKAGIDLYITIPRGNNINEYKLTRNWFLDDSLKEEFLVTKNGEPLDELQISDFENYIKNIIPPELFNLYFFDGEEIADFFMEENGEKRIKDAFITLCGYDVFEIMKKNFKRLASGTKEQMDIEEYLKVKDEFYSMKDEASLLEHEITEYNGKIKDCELKLKEIEKKYNNAGGITEKERKQKLADIAEEEKKRTVWNQTIKKLANDTIPFVIIKDLLDKTKKQLESESKSFKMNAFDEIIKDDSFLQFWESKGISNKDMILESLREYVSMHSKAQDEIIFGLSLEEEINLKNQINKFLKVDTNEILEIKKNIKHSIKKGAAIRDELENSNVNISEEFLKNKMMLLEDKNTFLNKVLENEKELNGLLQTIDVKEKNYEKIKTKIEKNIKDKSIADISSKAIIMLDKLNELLYHKEIKKVEDNFKEIINVLMYKMNFIDNIRIDDDFTIHVYRYETLEPAAVIEILNMRSLEEVRNIIGSAALEMLIKITKTDIVEEMISELKNINYSIMIPMEIDKSSFSAGEKQMFVMALYYSLMLIGKNEIPFIIDTPFARIDNEHRENISRYFFNKLKGQVFILSTDEEINSNHIKILKKKIAKTYLLENKDNNRTVVKMNNYFEV